MPSESHVELEIGHVLFVDIVGYSKLLIHEQSEHLQKLRAIARATEQFRMAEANGQLLRLPTGDGGALVFRNSPEAPVLCALEISEALKNHPELKVRMGVHSGPVKEVTDWNEQLNIAGAGVNIAQRVMDCADAGHILLSKRVADDLEQYSRWRPLLHELGECQVKHGLNLSIFNLYNDKVGNPEPPQRFKPSDSASQSTAPPTRPLAKSIAVLPFENLSEDKANAYFADGIQEEILTRLSRIGELKVISRTSTQRFKGAPENIREIARQLDVANLVEGSVQKAGEQVRVHVQLIDAENDCHLWAERYDRKLTDIFAVESDIASKIADALQATLTGAERRAIAAQPTKNTEAHDLYLKGKHHWRNFYAPGYERVREYFEQAVALDASYAPAYVGLSLYHSWAAANGIFAPEHWAPAEEAAQKALELDDTLAEAYNALAAVEIYCKRNWPAAERAFHRGMELDPNCGDLPAHYALCLSYFGRFEEAIAQENRAMELDPFFPGNNLHFGTILFFSRDYGRAAAQLAKTLELFPAYAAAHQSFGDVCAQKGNTDEAVIQWSAGLRLTGRAELAKILEETFASSGFDAAIRAFAQRKLQILEQKKLRGEYVPAWDYAMTYLQLGDHNQAIDWLAKAKDEPNWFALQLRINPVLDPLRDDPRFQELIRSLPN